MLHSMMLHSSKMGATMYEMHALIEASTRSKMRTGMRRNLLPTITMLTRLEKRNMKNSTRSIMLSSKMASDPTEDVVLQPSMKTARKPEPRTLSTSSAAATTSAAT